MPKAAAVSLEPTEFIRANTRLEPVRGAPEIRLHTVHPGSGLWRIGGGRGEPAAPYWAYAWGGGLVLARHILDHPETVAGRRVLDLGTGSGLVAIAAAFSGAAEVQAADIDPYAAAAARLNAIANDVSITVLEADITDAPPPAVDLILAGDVYYAVAVGARMTSFFDRCLAAGIDILIGDPGRAHLPGARLRRVAEYIVPDFGEPGRTAPSGVFAFGAA